MAQSFEVKIRATLLLSCALASVVFFGWIAFERRPPRADNRRQKLDTLDRIDTRETSEAPNTVLDSMEPAEPDTDTVELSPPIDLKAGPLAWESVVEGVMNGASSDTAKARQLLALLRALPEEALASTATTVLLRLPDGAYAAAQPLLLDPSTHGQVLSALFADLLNRPDAVALPNLLSIAASPEHPFRSAALDDLQLLLGKDHGTDWARWEAEVSEALTAQ